MKKKAAKPTDKKSEELNEDEKFPGYPAYPASEDITYRGEQEELDVEKVTRSSRINNELARDSSGNPSDQDEEEGLDVPGADLDDDNERIGEEDEENNYYSLGGDRHEDLEEDNDES
ncbi:hypothetical protein [Chitinophaga ginsengisoli]|uniref:Uncharacterized protein n=1 Tax=Chitinophaga ginsengisoli TaxID=363837 RepID=A0A2P8GNK1_9BACT|nr:hypothetical protein [Chitinophaga ginsengisoli]PSL35535.1 hypothetical protein CLV42_101295 [Chitinophaga ginsengisoli]